MKKIIKTAAYLILAVAAFGCAKSVSEGPNEANVRYFNSWMQVNHPDLKPTGLGIYILPTEPTGEETGIEVKEDGFVYADYVITNLEGDISDYTDMNTAKQLGTYNPTFYYGPKVLTTFEQALPAGVADAVIGMKVGERKKFIVPSWLMTYYDYDTEQEYINNSSNTSSAIYDITIKDYADSIQLHEIELIDSYLTSDLSTYNEWQNDTTGFYYRRLKAPVDTTAFASDTTIYINYTGKLLYRNYTEDKIDTLVFDTTIEKTAKDNGIYSSSKQYTPASVSWSETWGGITMGGSSVISGFAMTLWKMRPMEKGVGVFYSPLGYSYNGSGKSIPGYSPLIFEIEIVAKPEE